MFAKPASALLQIFLISSGGNYRSPLEIHPFLLECRRRRIHHATQEGNAARFDLVEKDVC